MTFTNVLENLSIVEMQSRPWDPTVLNDAEEVGNWGNQIESKQPFLFYSACIHHKLWTTAKGHTAKPYSQYIEKKTKKKKEQTKTKQTMMCSSAITSMP